MWLPAKAASVTCMGLLIDAAIISVPILWILKISAICFISSMPVLSISSSLPTNGLTNVAPAFAAKCLGCRKYKCYICFYIFTPTCQNMNILFFLKHFLLIYICNPWFLDKIFLNAFPPSGSKSIRLLIQNFAPVAPSNNTPT